MKKAVVQKNWIPSFTGKKRETAKSKRTEKKNGPKVTNTVICLRYRQRVLIIRRV